MNPTHVSTMGSASLLMDRVQISHASVNPVFQDPHAVKVRFGKKLEAVCLTQSVVFVTVLCRSFVQVLHRIKIIPLSFCYSSQQCYALQIFVIIINANTATALSMTCVTSVELLNSLNISSHCPFVSLRSCCHDNTNLNIVNLGLDF